MDHTAVTYSFLVRCTKLLRVLLGGISYGVRTVLGVWTETRANRAEAVRFANFAAAAEHYFRRRCPPHNVSGMSCSRHDDDSTPAKAKGRAVLRSFIRTTPSCRKTGTQ